MIIIYFSDSSALYSPSSVAPADRVTMSSARDANRNKRGKTTFGRLDTQPFPPSTEVDGKCHQLGNTTGYTHPYMMASSLEKKHYNQQRMSPVNPGFLGATCGTVLALPPSIPFSLALPAQNTCASCSLTFRMTSDLVYHMRTHHKRQQETDKLRRGEKLKCPICKERFRERHHLTRHMTAHEDKGEEVLEVAERSA